MSLPSYADVFNLNDDCPAGGDVHEGDVVRMGNNYHPHYSVIAIHGEKAWVRNLQSGEDCLAQVSRCRRLDLAQAA
jgi:hypothetical protein